MPDDTAPEAEPPRTDVPTILAEVADLQAGLQQAYESGDPVAVYLYRYSGWRVSG